jgi:hypothetical protein
MFSQKVQIFAPRKIRMPSYFLLEKGSVAKRRKKWSAEKSEEHLYSFFKEGAQLLKVLFLLAG